MLASELFRPIAKVVDGEGHAHGDDGKFSTTSGHAKPKARKPKPKPTAEPESDKDTISTAGTKREDGVALSHAGKTWTGAGRRWDDDIEQYALATEFFDDDRRNPEYQKQLKAQQDFFVSRNSHFAEAMANASLLAEKVTGQHAMDGHALGEDTKPLVKRQKIKAEYAPLFLDSCRMRRLQFTRPEKWDEAVRYHIRTAKYAEALATAKPRKLLDAMRLPGTEHLKPQEVAREYLLFRHSIDLQPSGRNEQWTRAAGALNATIEPRALSRPTAAEMGGRMHMADGKLDRASPTLPSFNPNYSYEQNVYLQIDKALAPYQDRLLWSVPTPLVIGTAKGEHAGDVLGCAVSDPMHGGGNSRGVNIYAHPLSACFVSTVAHEVGHAHEKQAMGPEFQEFRDYVNRKFDIGKKRIKESLPLLYDVGRSHGITPARVRQVARAVLARDHLTDHGVSSGDIDDYGIKPHEDWAIGISEGLMHGPDTEFKGALPPRDSVHFLSKLLGIKQVVPDSDLREPPEELPSVLQSPSFWEEEIAQRLKPGNPMDDPNSSLSKVAVAYRPIAKVIDAEGHKHDELGRFAEQSGSAHPKRERYEKPTQALIDRGFHTHILSRDHVNNPTGRNGNRSAKTPASAKHISHAGATWHGEIKADERDESAGPAVRWDDIVEHPDELFTPTPSGSPLDDAHTMAAAHARTLLGMYYNGMPVESYNHKTGKYVANKIPPIAKREALAKKYAPLLYDLNRMNRLYADRKSMASATRHMRTRKLAEAIATKQPQTWEAAEALGKKLQAPPLDVAREYALFRHGIDLDDPRPNDDEFMSGNVKSAWDHPNLHPDVISGIMREIEHGLKGYGHKHVGQVPIRVVVGTPVANPARAAAGTCRFGPRPEFYVRSETLHAAPMNREHEFSKVVAHEMAHALTQTALAPEYKAFRQYAGNLLARAMRHRDRSLANICQEKYGIALPADAIQPGGFNISAFNQTPLTSDQIFALNDDFTALTDRWARRYFTDHGINSENHKQGDPQEDWAIGIQEHLLPLGRVYPFRDGDGEEFINAQHHPLHETVAKIAELLDMPREATSAKLRLRNEPDEANAAIRMKWDLKDALDKK